MATKRIRRSVVEGGTIRAYRRLETYAQRAYRVHQRRVCHDAVQRYNAGDDIDDIDVFPLRNRLFWMDGRENWRNHALYAWIDAQHGRPWDAVWSDMVHKLKMRDVAAYHYPAHWAVDDFVRAMYRYQDLENPRLFLDYWVDDKGMFCVRAHCS